MNRRTLLKCATALTAIGGLLGSGSLSQAWAKSQSPENIRNYYPEMQCRPHWLTGGECLHAGFRDAALAHARRRQDRGKVQSILDGDDVAVLGSAARRSRSYPDIIPCTGCYNFPTHKTWPSTTSSTTTRPRAIWNGYTGSSNTPLILICSSPSQRRGVGNNHSRHFLQHLTETETHQTP